MKIQIEVEQKEIAALVAALQERQVRIYRYSDLDEKIRGFTVDLSSHDTPKEEIEE